MSHCVEPCGGLVSPGFGGACGPGSSLGTILVLFILLVIILRVCIF